MLVRVWLMNFGSFIRGLNVSLEFGCAFSEVWLGALGALSDPTAPG